ncbi:hypothetical protein DXU92_12940 [Brachybacterium saurashtrense]|uniref:Uncharacterized protein n=1 Tax=Brachybacterium saurashtrense TaxID=556288 RepID=A0A345YLW6_9MICO|nr:hypothetical protein DWV08_04365 [Brachybacterium saurashtrense]RRR21602.1 hypothetical protein DXU92_12940 [Brachybacterium saurashtrense]
MRTDHVGIVVEDPVHCEDAHRQCSARGRRNSSSATLKNSEDDAPRRPTVTAPQTPRIDTRRGSELGGNPHRDITGVLVLGVAEDFPCIHSGPDALPDAFAHMLLLERFQGPVVAEIPKRSPLSRSVTRCVSLRGGASTSAPAALARDEHQLVICCQCHGADEGSWPGSAEIGFVATASRSVRAGVPSAARSSSSGAPTQDIALGGG